MNSDHSSIKHFYISEEQSIYLLSHKDARRQRAWEKLCQQQLKKLGYTNIELIGKGAYGFAFSGLDQLNRAIVFKFSRMTLPQQVQDRLEDEGFMQSRIKSSGIPAFHNFQRVGAQRILVMDRAPGIDLDQWLLLHGKVEPRVIIKIAHQLVNLIKQLREYTQDSQPKCIVHGDIKPSNIVFNSDDESIQLIDWGSSVFAQLDASGQPMGTHVMDLMSGDIFQTNSKLGDVYFIGEEQISGKQSSPRFDEQGLAATLYAIAANMPCRFGHSVINPNSLGLPIEFATILTNLLSDDLKTQRAAGDYLLANMDRLSHLVMPPQIMKCPLPEIPVWIHEKDDTIDSVVYTSRKNYMRQHNIEDNLHNISDAQLDRYYKNYLGGMGEKEKGLLAAVSRLGSYPLLGGLSIQWYENGRVDIDSSLNLYEPQMKTSLVQLVNNIVQLARSINKPGIFKSCMFNARDTIHIERDSLNEPFIPDKNDQIHYFLSDISWDDQNMEHSYFEDGDDPDELLQLPEEIMVEIEALNKIHHTGMIIFEALETHLKVHNYYRLLDNSKEEQFRTHLNNVIEKVPLIRGLGISGFMKLPFKNTRIFSHKACADSNFYPTNPKK